MNRMLHTVPFNIELGMTLYLQPTGNAALRWDGSPLIGKVTAIKRKYFYVQIDRTQAILPADLDTYICKAADANSGYLVFPSLQNYMQAQEKEHLRRSIKSAWEQSNSGKYLTYDTIFQIQKILAADNFFQSRN